MRQRLKFPTRQITRTELQLILWDGDHFLTKDGYYIARFENDEYFLDVADNSTPHGNLQYRTIPYSDFTLYVKALKQIQDELHWWSKTFGGNLTVQIL